MMSFSKPGGGVMTLLSNSSPSSGRKNGQLACGGIFGVQAALSACGGSTLVQATLSACGKSSSLASTPKTFFRGFLLPECQKGPL